MTSAALDYHVVDVFTDQPYAGNPLAVVLDADALDTAAMQSIAREFNLSETTFVLTPTTPEATYRLRIFTPSGELPFAGHPSVGSSWVLRSLGRYGDGSVVQECGAGLLPVVVSATGAELTGGTPAVTEPEDATLALAAAGLDRADLAGSELRWAGCGINWAFLHVRDDAVARARPDLRALADLGPSGVCVFSYADGFAHARVFAGDLGVPEDPATGSAALGLGVYLVAAGLLPADGESAYVVRQGVEMGRPSTLHGTVSAEAGVARRATVSGGVMPVATGRISPPTA